MKKREKDKRNLGDTFFIGNIKTSNVTQKEAEESSVNSFLEGLKALKKEKRKKD